MSSLDDRSRYKAGGASNRFNARHRSTPDVTSKNKVKILLDLGMALLFLLLMNTRITGVFAHEVIGTGILAIFIAHLVINRQWIGSVFRRLGKNNIPTKMTVSILLNATIGIGSLVTIVTGAMISQYLFVSLAVADTSLWYTVHDVAAWVTLCLIMGHTLLHWRWFKSIANQFAKRGSEVRAFAVKAGASLLALGAVISLLNTNIDDIMLSSTTTSTSYTAEQTTTSSESYASAPPDSYDDDSSDAESVSSSSSSSSSSDSGLTDYLGTLYCTACNKHCPLSSPRCGRAESEIEEATATYNDTIA